VVALAVAVFAAPAHATPSFADPIIWGQNLWGFSTAIADVTGDGRPDVVATNGGSPNSTYLRVFPQQSDGSLGQPLTYALASAPLTIYPYWGIGTGDLNGDGTTDVAVATPGGIDLLYQKSGVLQPATLLPGAPAANDVKVADLNGDGRADIVAGTLQGVLLFVSGTLGFTQQTLASWAPSAIGIADVNGDGRYDVVDLAQRNPTGYWRPSTRRSNRRRGSQPAI
jgi:hypothetical protein